MNDWVWEPIRKYPDIRAYCFICRRWINPRGSGLIYRDRASGKWLALCRRHAAKEFQRRVEIAAFLFDQGN